MNPIVRVLSLIFALLFVIAAYFQWNDPDAVTWYFIYGIAALASILFYLRRLGFWPALVLFLLYLIGAVGMWPETFEGITIGSGEIENIERGREALGLLITAFIMLIYAVQVRLAKKRS